MSSTSTLTRTPHVNRILNVVRLQLINRETYIWIPLMVFGGAFVLSLMVFALIPYDGVKAGGGAYAPFWYFAVVGAQALTKTFPFSQAMSVTRREFYFGTLLTAAGTSALLAIIYVIGGFIETATQGWGVNGYFFTLDPQWATNPAIGGVFYFVMAMLFFVVGFWGATIYKRFGGIVFTAITIAIALAFVGGMWLVGRMDAWEAFFGWFFSIGAGGLTLMIAGLVVLLAAIAFPALRKAVP